MTAPLPLEAHRLACTLLGLLAGATPQDAVLRANGRTLDHVERVGRRFAGSVWSALDSDARRDAIAAGLVAAGHDASDAVDFADSWRESERVTVNV